MKIYQSLRMQNSPDDRFGPSIHHSREAPALVGFMCGNSPHPGCLTSDTNVRLHSCEKGNMCGVAQQASVVRIQPVIAHLSDGRDMSEVGVGGGGDDLEREAELDHLSADDLQALLTR
jgi:DNA cross-link repair 1C protein